MGLGTGRLGARKRLSVCFLILFNAGIIGFENGEVRSVVNDKSSTAQSRIGAGEMR